MTIRFYGVLDAEGTKINTITADDSLIASAWWPGYGAVLVDEGAVPSDPLPVPAPIRPKSWSVVAQLVSTMERGDRLDLKTMTVTKAAELVDIAVTADLI